METSMVHVQDLTDDASYLLTINGVTRIVKLHRLVIEDFIEFADSEGNIHFSSPNEQGVVIGLIKT